MLAPGEFRLYSTQNFSKPDITTEVDELPKPKEAFVLWPNPVNDYLKISSDIPLSGISVYSVLGSKMKEVILSGSEASATELYLGDLQRGSYIIQVIGKGGKKESRKIIKY